MAWYNPLHVGNNKISEKGWLYFTRSAVGKLAVLQLSSITVRQIKTKLEMRGAGIFPREIGSI